MGASNIPRCVLLGATAGVPARRTCAELCFQAIPLVTLPTWSRTWQRTRSFIITTSTRRPATCTGTQAIRARVAGLCSSHDELLELLSLVGLGSATPRAPARAALPGMARRFPAAQEHRAPFGVGRGCRLYSERQGHTSRSVAGR